MLEEYYTNYDEDGRLKKDNVHAVEYQTTLHFLMKHLPCSSTVLDCCAGCGVYAFPLAKAGFKVTAGDLIQKHVDILNSENTNGLLECVYQGNVLDMSRFENGLFDAVLCMGVLYHLHDKDDREKCVAECLRVLKSGGIFIFAYINRNAVYINHFKNNVSDIETRKTILKDGKNSVFYAMDFDEPQKLTSKFEFQQITNIGVDGLIYPLYNEINALTLEEFNSYMEYHFASCEQPSIIGHSMHGLWIGRKI